MATKYYILQDIVTNNYIFIGGYGYQQLYITATKYYTLQHIVTNNYILQDIVTKNYTLQDIAANNFTLQNIVINNYTLQDNVTNYFYTGYMYSYQLLFIYAGYGEQLPTKMYVNCTGYCYQLLYMQHSHQQLYITGYGYQILHIIGFSYLQMFTGYGYQQSFPEEEVQYNA